MTWVPSYAREICRDRLDESFGEVGLKNGLTHMGLQFWRPTEEGRIGLVDDFKPIYDSTIINFRKWGQTHGIKVLLCIYNGTRDGWNWNLAKNAFETHRKQFIKTLVSETVRLNLDGVDIDFEGKGKLDGDTEVFVSFIKELSSALKAKGKELTVDSFAYKWNAPNQGWWKLLLPYVDALHVMGYSETGSKSTSWRSYDFLKAAAGKYSSKLLIGVPSHASNWEKASVQEHLEWIVTDPSVGLAIWDAQLKDSKWRTQEIWQTISRIRQGVDFNSTVSPTIHFEKNQEFELKN
ncbi:glycoside hydrolase family 18 protein [Opitutales bacterium]|nr:glycoside hydrolase family 18 protein [Opitutales bacterium]